MNHTFPDHGEILTQSGQDRPESARLTLPLASYDFSWRLGVQKKTGGAGRSTLSAEISQRAVHLLRFLREAA